jgi:hypothetical protein
MSAAVISCGPTAVAPRQDLGYCWTSSGLGVNLLPNWCEDLADLTDFLNHGDEEMADIFPSPESNRRRRSVRLDQKRAVWKQSSSAQTESESDTDLENSHSTISKSSSKRRKSLTTSSRRGKKKAAAASESDTTRQNSSGSDIDEEGETKPPKVPTGKRMYNNQK